MSVLNQTWKRWAVVVAAVVALASPALAADQLRVEVGRAVVVTSPDEVKTVAIAEPKIADAAVGSARTVVVNGKSPGLTTLVVYNEGGRYQVYDVQVFVPNMDKQVILHVHVSELNKDAQRELGFDFFGQGQSNVPWLDGTLQGGLFTTKIANPSAPLTLGPSTDGFLNYNKNDGRLTLQTTWKALEQKGDIRTLASPTLVAKSGDSASFLAGGEFPIPIAQSGGAATSSGAITAAITIAWKEFGVKVRFTPIVNTNGIITLKVAPEVSQIDFTNPLIIEGFRVPVIITRRAETVVDLREGEYLVIGGLKEKDTNKAIKRVPILGQIPILGWFFSTKRTETSERELVFVVTPEIVTAATTLPPLPTDRPEMK
ncbi:MAG TPA: pilus assembly protein N-terminal domain-containing protein [Candidatus Eisenbacteria bacterium]|nr:pilus assembly protein N-terminal domain-containing protein [Candidatus Eisenbacteria bacterium]